ncbi:AIPR family protein [Citrobacter koseri]|uniref:AIPR family protein n=1 Tax=Citrobacter koseri TaxID=545 RepID=UPI0018E1999E|nr:AIPR family protein [Citrobacter koseri]MBI0675748.1 AIPR family protein [Citrobacter koseri]
MDAQEFRKDFLEEVKINATATGEGSCASFVSAFSRRLQDIEFLSDFTSSYFEGTGKYNKKIRVDGYSYDEFDKTMHLVIADYDGSTSEAYLSKIKARKIQKRLVNFTYEARNNSLHQRIEMSRPCWDLVDLMKEKELELRKYSFHIFTSSIIPSDVIKLESEDIDEIPTECQIWSIERLFYICSSDIGRNAVEIDFKEYTSNGISCLNASETITKDFRSFLCIIPGTVLADIYDKYGSLLLEGNVRSFLSTKVAVNKKIRTTIIDFPERFFAYNNGISATAMNVQIESTSEGQRLIAAKDFQIINGGQTTASLSNARYKDKCNLNEVFVQMKLTVIEKIADEEAIKLIQDISRSSNSQNKVSDADFFSTHPFHVQMEHFSQKLYARAINGSQFDTKWFYERARGQYLQKQMRLTRAEKKKFLLQNPKNQLITKTDLAKVRNTWDGFPHIVSRGAQTNFIDFAEKTTKEWNKGEVDKFSDKYFQETVALLLIYKYMEKMIPNQTWYLLGYRANIITYTIAFMRMLIKKQFNNKDLDLISIWSRQAVPNTVQQTLIDLSEKVYFKITDSTRSVENVTQWCKREECWNSVKNISYILPDSIENFLTANDKAFI